MNLDGTGQTNLANNLSENDYNATWSPDGTRIAYAVTFPVAAEAIHTMNPDGTGDSTVASISGGRSPDWSPDGTRLAISVSDGEGGSSIVLINSDGTGTPMTLTSGFDDGTPAWSPDGTQILFSRSNDGPPDIYVMDADGTNVTNSTNDPNFFDGSPAWSPDGTQIAFLVGPPVERTMDRHLRDGCGRLEPDEPDRSPGELR